MVGAHRTRRLPLEVETIAARHCSANPSEPLVVGCAALAALLLLPPDERLRRELRGRVIDERRFPVAGATIVARWRNEDGSIVESQPATSGPAGAFAVASEFVCNEWESASCELAVRADDERVAWQLVWLHRHELDLNESIELRMPLLARPASTWQVEVVDGSGPVPDAIVELFGANGTIPFASARTDESGHVAIGGVPQGACHLLARHPTRGRSTVGVVKALPNTAVARVELVPTRTIEVEVVDADGAAPIAGARVLVSLLLPIPNGSHGKASRHAWPLLAAESTADAAGRLTLRDLPGDLPLELDAVAPHWTAKWELGGRRDTVPRQSGHTSVELAADATTATLRMKALVPTELRWTVHAESDLVPPEGTPIELRPLSASRWLHRMDEGLPTTAVMRGGALVAEAEVVAGDPRKDLRAWVAQRDWFAVAPGGAVAALRRGSKESPYELFFESTTTLDVTLLAADGRPLVGEGVWLQREIASRAESHPIGMSGTADERGIVRFKELRSGRWHLSSLVATRTIRLDGAPSAIVLQRPASATATEIRFEFSLEGERRLPAELQIGFQGGDGIERVRDRIELPERGDVRCFFEPRGRSSEWSATVGWTDGSRRVELPPLPAPGTTTAPIVVPVDLSAKDRGEAEVRVHGTDAKRIDVTLERVAPDGGAITRHRGTGRETGRDVATVTFRDLEFGTWRASAHFGLIQGEPFVVAATGAPARVELDVSHVVELPVQWQVPDGESRALAEVVASGAVPFERGLSSEQEEWREMWQLDVAASPTTDRFLFDGAHPPKLEIRHPYLRSSRWNDAIDLAKPRSVLTLHLELGPLLEFTPRFEVEPPANSPKLPGMWLRVAPLAADEGERRVALRRGATFATAPLPTGNWRVLIDPQIAAPAEIERFESDGGARDLGPIAFARGSTLRIRVVAPDGSAAPRVVARAERQDGLRYLRRSKPPPEPIAFIDPEIPALGAGRSASSSLRRWAAAPSGRRPPSSTA